MSAVDVHAHVVVPEVLREAAPAEGWRPALRRINGRRVVEFDGRRIDSMIHEFVSLEQILATEERAGIDHVVLSPWVPLLGYDVDPEEGLRRCQIQNCGLARMRAERPDRVRVLGAVPLQDPFLATAELEAMMLSGSFAGVEITASVRGSYLGDAQFAPFWAAAEATGALVFIHPTTRGFGEPVFRDYYLHNLVGNPMETTLTAAHMVLAGVMERHPDLKVVLAHGGGAILTLRGRLRHGHEAIPAAGRALSESPEESIRRFYFDTVTHDPRLLRELVHAVGAERVLLGSDYPFDMADPHPVETVRRAGLEEDEEAALLRGNAERLLTIGVRRASA
jgi:aminocarboxymuconate-semialdehyde decarboxylase